ncbi:UbiX family flavin prenyltransferase [Megamonas funiformis]|uniref:UbiX family flavin prenyltransferase n=1 Tax=Megamonas funiformis TaxID=437897 RepID=UPI001430A90B|nr:UbiX family flavin prenyltransferase [Megamonas funiformis]NJE28171.1 UbiX family flavin prenyltransferase [Megamonas funiformis]
MKTKSFERKRRIIVGVSGASGAIYAYRLIQVLADSGIEVHFVASKAGLEVLEYECGLTMVQLTQMVHKIYDVNRIDSAIASGSFPCESMVIVPCSMKTLGSLANGIAGNLLTRAADVTLKEGRKLVLVTRETPVHAIHLENMLKLSHAGARIVPACPGFYHRPQTIEELVDMLVGKICDTLNVDNDLFERWTGPSEV